jgi:hypothetical protein
LKVVRLVCLVDTKQSLGPRFGGSRHEGVHCEAQVDHLRHSKFAGLREDKDARTVSKVLPHDTTSDAASRIKELVLRDTVNVGNIN